jgi:hypothetical protein
MWKQKRQQSYFYNMRKYHNAIKRDLYNRYTNENTSVLELAVGKGGDLQKLFDNRVKSVIGYDIDSKSIEEANRRLSEYPDWFQRSVRLGVKDLSSDVIDGNKTFDVLSAMFSFHYFFKSEETFEAILTSIENNLKVGGVFMGTFFDGASVRERLRYPFNDKDHFRIEQKVNNEKSLFGNTINVLQRDTDVSSIYNPEDEYIVDFDRFTKSMYLLGFELVESRLFSEMDSSTFYNMSNTEKDVSFLNRTFVFKRVFDLDKQLECVYKSCKVRFG